MTLYRVMVLSGDMAEVEIEAESASAARDLAQAQWEFEPEQFEERNFSEADTWWDVEELCLPETTNTERASSAAPTGVL
jgi:hypothetical protein